MDSHEKSSIVTDKFSNCRSRHVEVLWSKFLIVFFNDQVSISEIFGQQLAIVFRNFIIFPKFYLVFFDLWNFIQIQPICVSILQWLLLNRLFGGVIQNRKISWAFHEEQTILWVNSNVRFVVSFGCYLDSAGGWYGAGREADWGWLVVAGTSLGTLLSSYDPSTMEYPCGVSTRFIMVSPLLIREPLLSFIWYFW